MFILLFVAAVLLSGPAAAGDYIRLGEYYQASGGATSQYLRLRNANEEYQDWLRWGYDIWGVGTEPVPEPGWLVSEDLHEPPYNVPRNATAVKLHIKAKAAGVTWADNAVSGSLQVMVRPHGSSISPNEVVHASTQKPGGFPQTTPYDLNHVETNVPLGKDGKIEIYQHASIRGNYLELDLIVYLAGYWAPGDVAAN